MENIILTTPCGQIKGLDFEEHIEFRGVKYAESKRWEYAVPIHSWEGVYDATEYGPNAYQRRSFEDDAVCGAFYHKEFRDGLTFTYSEDCLSLNIWAPKNCENAPVVIYIHGGSFTGGSNNEGQISGIDFAKHGFVFVSINYRLNVFGFACHPDMTTEDGRCGNFGLYDQLCAIEWVKDNIAAFGGNGKDITLIGASAGAMSIDMLISSPLCKDLFKGAIMMSGTGIQRYAARPRTPEQSRAFWEAVIKNAGVNNIEELKTVDEKTLFYAWDKAVKSTKLGQLYTLPCYDGALVTKASYNADTVPNMPLIVGVTLNDMVPIALEAFAKRFGKAAQKYGQCYFYNFHRETPGDVKGAWHSCDLFYAFSTLDFNWRPYEEIDYKISKQLSEAFYAFCRTGNPDCDAIPHWKPDYKTPMRFCEYTKPEKWDTRNLLRNTFHKEKAAF